MWKFITRGIRESLERRACRTNVYSQNSQDQNGNNNEEKNIVVLSDRKFITPCFSAFYHGDCRNTKHLGRKDKENKNKYDAKYTWTDAFGWSSVLAVGYVVCQSLCIRRKLYEIDNTNLEKWRYKLLIQPQIQASRLINNLLLPQPKYVLPVSIKPVKLKGKSEILIDDTPSISQPYGPITAEEALEQAVNEFSNTHNTILGELELDFGSIAIEEKRYEDAIEHFNTGAKLSSVASMFNLALCYELGLGTSVDYVKAAEYYKKAADEGHADAMYNLGVFHAQGRGGLEINLNTARKLFTEAAKKGQIQALTALQLERSVRKSKNLKHDIKYHAEKKSVNYKSEKQVMTNLINCNNFLATHLNDQRIEPDQFINTYQKNVSSKSPTEMVLDILGIHERSAISLISNGGSGP